MTLSTRNAKGVAANFVAADARAQRAIKKIVRASGVRVHERQRALAPVDTGFMRSQLRVEFTEGGYAYEAGYRESDFDAAGEPFYPVYVEFGTATQPAQPHVFPARDEEAPRFRRELRDALSAAIRRRTGGGGAG